ncbi:MAG: hypothetical protein HQL08_14075 [Nitrospirae bacterium]|nr:hypothetical protein [Nitrospirota bacterium]
MSYDFEQFKGIGVLKLYGDYTCRNAANVKKAFFVALSNSEHLIVDFEGVSKIDDFLWIKFLRSGRFQENRGKS